MSDTRPRAALYPSGAPRWRLIYVIAYGALVPMALMALGLWTPHAPWRYSMSLALGAYAAMMLSYICGFHWGLGLRYMATTGEMPTFHFIWGPVLPLLAWGTLLLPPSAALLVLALLHAVSHAVDHLTWPGSGLGPWLGLRLQVTAVALACCLLGALGPEILGP